MVNLTAEMAQLWASIGPSPSGRGRVLQFVAATRGEGASSIARVFARFAAARDSRPVWLVDLDLRSGGQHEAIAAEPEHFGMLGQPAAASPDGSAFFTIRPAARAADGRLIPDGHYFCGQRAGGSRLWVTRLRREMLR